MRRVKQWENTGVTRGEKGGNGISRAGSVEWKQHEQTSTVRSWMLYENQCVLVRKLELSVLCANCGNDFKGDITNKKTPDGAGVFYFLRPNSN
jgi:hypothetical protein